MKRYLLPQTGNFYKANLHCHTTVSTGKLTPEAVKDIYKSRGYSIVAYTDHDIMIDQSRLADDTFLPLLGYEIEITEENGKPFYESKTCHLCLIAENPKTAKQVCFHRSRYLPGNSASYLDQAKYDTTLPDYERQYTPACINDIIKQAREEGFFVTYNHPTWSREEASDFLQYEGLDAMEICNNCVLIAGFPEYNPYTYDQLLRSGKKLYCIAADDTKGPITCGGAFTVIKADKLDYAAIMQALRSGHFYASTGPEIRALWYEDGLVHIECSPAYKITVNMGIRRALHKTAPSYDAPITEATFPIPSEAQYFRLTVTDVHGRHADTNAYFLEEL